MRLIAIFHASWTYSGALVIQHFFVGAKALLNVIIALCATLVTVILFATAQANSQTGCQYNVFHSANIIKN